jgi:hypothetical protein
MVPFIIVPLKKKGLVWQGAMLGHVPLAGVAQLVEHLICNQRVRGSNPFASSRESVSGTSGLKYKAADGFSHQQSIREFSR